VPTGNHKRLWRTMTGIKPCWSVVRVRGNDRTHAGVNGSCQEKGLSTSAWICCVSERGREEINTTSKLVVC